MMIPAYWAETASKGDRLAYWASMTVEETASGYTVTHDDSGRVVWSGKAASNEDAYARAERADHGSRCGWDDAELDDAKRILRRGGLTLATDDLGLYAAEVQS